MIGCLRLSDVSVICRVVNPRRRRTSPKFGEVSCTECRPTSQGNDFKLIPMGKMENRNPAEGSLIMNFWRSVIIAELWRSEVARRYFFEKFLRFVGKIFKILFRKFSSRHGSTCSNFVKFDRGESMKSCVAYLTKISPGSPDVATRRIARKCQHIVFPRVLC